MEYFVDKDSIVRKIWGKSDTILLIFAGASAEFALNKAVDWLYYTGRLPADPIGRLFSTVSYARQIVFLENKKAFDAIDKITKIHEGVEKSRGGKIPDWAYRDVLFMLIHYSIASFEVLERNLTPAEKEEVYNVFFRMGKRMMLMDLPDNYLSWLPIRDQHMEHDLAKSNFTIDLYNQYKKHLGSYRFFLLKEGQKLVCPAVVKKLIGLNKKSILTSIIPVYKLFKKLKMEWLIKEVILPAKYKKQIKELDIVYS
jgi:hypothetical protein